MESKINLTQVTVPNLDLEFEFFNSGCRYVAGIDEVGRGALAGPVTVGVAVLGKNVGQMPDKLSDSKLISKSVREALVPQLIEWVEQYSIGFASPSEIDDVGIINALRLAAKRALADLTVTPDQLILDGKHNWLVHSEYKELAELNVVTKIKADQTCASVSAASVLAKVERDRLMVSAADDYPEFGFAKNVGYGSAQHLAAIRKFGPTEFHRRSWNLPTKD